MRGYSIAMIAMAVLSACASAPYSLQRPAAGSFASLTMLNARPDAAWAHYAGNGINSIDGHAVSVPVGTTLYLREGRRVVGYLCPGWVSVDTGPTLTHDFKTGAAYVLDCTASPDIREATAAD